MGYRIFLLLKLLLVICFVGGSKSHASNWEVSLYELHSKQATASLSPEKGSLAQWLRKTRLEIRTWIQHKATHSKAVAILLTVALGPFGVHRLYLGTKATVPIIYTVTLGGGLGILPLLDIIAILATPDWTPYLDNDKVIMWAK